MKKPRRVVATLLLWPWLTAFDLSRHSILPEEILGGGPPKDGIPAILEPRFVPSAEATFLRDDDRVIGVVRKGAAKAYPHGLCQIQRTIPWRSTRMSVGIAMESKPWVVNAPAAYNLMRSRKALRTRRRTSSGISSSESSPVSLITSL